MKIRLLDPSRHWRLSYCLIGLLPAIVMTPQVLAASTTTVQDVVYRADGQPASGPLVISWPAFTTAESGVRSPVPDKGADSRLPTPHPFPDAPQSQQAGIFFPSADAKPLFDRLADCKAMESQLSACQQNYADMKKERDLAVKARQGSFWQRAKQIGIGIAIGGFIGYAAHK